MYRWLFDLWSVRCPSSVERKVAQPRHSLRQKESKKERRKKKDANAFDTSTPCVDGNPAPLERHQRNLMAVGLATQSGILKEEEKIKKNNNKSK